MAGEPELVGATNVILDRVAMTIAAGVLIPMGKASYRSLHRGYLHFS